MSEFKVRQGIEMKKLNPSTCPFCGAELKITENGRFRYFIHHKCKSGLTVSVPLGNKKDVLAIASKRVEQKENKEMCEIKTKKFNLQTVKELYTQASTPKYEEILKKAKNAVKFAAQNGQATTVLRGVNEDSMQRIQAQLKNFGFSVSVLHAGDDYDLIIGGWDK